MGFKIKRGLRKFGFFGGKTRQSQIDNDRRAFKENVKPLFERINSDKLMNMSEFSHTIYREKDRKRTFESFWEDEGYRLIDSLNERIDAQNSSNEGRVENYQAIPNVEKEHVRLLFEHIK